MVITSKQPLIFISCGQYSPEEKRLGNEIDDFIRNQTPFDSYFAEQQNTLDGLAANILGSLSRCVGFIGVMHHRGKVETLKSRITRGSVWVEQELAIAAFIQYALKRRIEVALYIEKGIHREGMREQLRLKPVEFSTADEVLADLRDRIPKWSLVSTPSQSLIAEWQRVDRRITAERHDYTLKINLLNNGARKIDDWRIEVSFPVEFLEDEYRFADDYMKFEDDDAQHPANKRKLYPDDRLEIFTIDYYVDGRNWPGNPPWPGQKRRERSMKIRVCSGDTEPWEKQVPMSELEKF